MPARVLLVEDEDVLRRVLARSLAWHGCSVDQAAAVSAALACCATDWPDVLVLDLNLPDGIGWELLRQLEQFRQPRPGVIVISAMAPARAALAEFGPLIYLQKPFAIDALLVAIDRAMKVTGDARLGRAPG